MSQFGYSSDLGYKMETQPKPNVSGYAPKPAVKYERTSEQVSLR
jgi:hypothetical protein